MCMLFHVMYGLPLYEGLITIQIVKQNGAEIRIHVIAVYFSEEPY